MKVLLYFAVLAALLVGYYEMLGPGPSPSEYVEDLEWWRPWGWAHSAEALSALQELALAKGRGALLPLGLFWLPALAILALGFRLFRSAVLRTLATTAVLLLLIFTYYGYMAERVWRFFEWRSPAVAAAFAGMVAIALFAPSLLRAALARSRLLALLGVVVGCAGIFLLSTEITGTDAYMRLNVSPWPVVTLFGLMLLGGALATFHIAAGLGSFLAARAGGTRGLLAGALASGAFAAALSWAMLQSPRSGTLVGTAIIGAGYAFVRARRAPEGRDEAARSALLTLGAGLVLFLAIHGSNRVAIAFQKTARNETATKLLVSLDKFRDAHGSFPRRLDGLVPEFFSEVPYPRIGLIRHEDDEFTYRNLGDSFLLEFSSVQWVQCGYSPPFDLAKYGDEDVDEEDEEDEADIDEANEEFRERQAEDPELKVLLAEHGLDGAWNCEDAPPKLW